MSVRDVMTIRKCQSVASYQEGLDELGCDSPIDSLFLKKMGGLTLRTTQKYELLNTLSGEVLGILTVQYTAG
jgi:hypothetical protein